VLVFIQQSRASLSRYGCCNAVSAVKVVRRWSLTEQSAAFRGVCVPHAVHSWPRLKVVYAFREKKLRDQLHGTAFADLLKTAKVDAILPLLVGAFGLTGSHPGIPYKIRIGTEVRKLRVFYILTSPVPPGRYLWRRSGLHKYRKVASRAPFCLCRIAWR
jgi:hypothetical protein